MPRPAIVLRGGLTDASSLFLGREDDFHAVMPAAFAFVATLVGWPSCFAVDSPVVLAALSGVLSAVLRFQSFFDGWVLEPHVFLPLFLGMVAVALPSVGSAW